MQAPTPETMVDLLHSMYTTQHNDERRKITTRLLVLENSLTGKEALDTGLGLLLMTNRGAATQAYGAVLLMHALRASRLHVNQIPFWDLLSWYCNEPTLGRLLCTGMARLLVECVVQETAQDFVTRVLQAVCAVDGMQDHPKRVLLLQLLVTTLLEPDFDTVPRERAGPLKRSITPHLATLLTIATNTLFAYYVASGQAAAIAFSPGTEPCVEACLNILCTAANNAPYATWQDVSLVDTLVAMLNWEPAKKQVLIVITSLLRVGERVEADQGRALLTLLTSVLGNLLGYIASGDIDVVDEVLGLLEEMPKALVQAAEAEVYCALLPVFGIPSIYFAMRTCTLLSHMSDSAVASLNPLDVYNAVRPFVPKNRFHPHLGTEPDGVRLSVDQLGYVGYYEQTFADFRSVCGKVLERLARAFPSVSNQYVFELLSELCDPSGTAADARTNRGFVTQQSPTYISWEATQFLVDCLSEAFRHCSDYVSQCIDCLLARQPTDAVLLPVYFNTLTTFWRCGDDKALNVWEGTLHILLKALEGMPEERMDPDEAAARRRALTLLVRGCTEHVHQLGSLVPSVIKRMEPLFITLGGQDRSLLYEALAALTNSLAPPETDMYLQPIINPVTTIFLRTLDGVDQSGFNSIIIGASDSLRSHRDDIRDCLNVLAAVLRRCRMTPFMLEKVAQLTPSLSHLLSLLHNINPADLPPAFSQLLNMDNAEREQFLPGHSRRSVIAGGDNRYNSNNNQLRRARIALEQIRVALYQLLGSLSGVLPREQFTDVLRQVTGIQHLPVHSKRRVTERLLFPIGQQYPDLLPLVLGALESSFLEREAEVKQARQRERDDIIDGKQWLYFAKDALTYARTRVLEPGLWRQDIAQIAAVCSLGIAVLRSNCDNRNVSRFLSQILDLIPDNCSPSVQDGLLQQQQNVYNYLVRYVIYADHSTLPPKEREMVAYGITEPYIRLFPELRAALSAAGIPSDKIDEVHAHLLISGKGNVKRRKLRDFLLSFVSPSS